MGSWCGNSISVVIADPSVDKPLTQRSAAYITAASYPIGRDVKLSTARMSSKPRMGAELCHRPQFPPLPLREAGPHARALRVRQGVGEAFPLDRTDRTDGPGLGRVGAERRKEQSSVLATTLRPLRPPGPMG